MLHQSHAIYVLLVSHSPSQFKSVLLQGQMHFVLMAILRQVHRMTPKWSWTLKGQRYLPYIHLTSSPEPPQLQFFRSTASRFQVGAHFKRSAPNDPKIALNILRSNVPHIHVTTTPVPQISLSFTLRPVFYGNFETSAPNDPKWHWTPKGQRCHIYMLQPVPGPKFHSVSFYSQPLSSYRPFWDKCTEWTPNYNEH